MSEKSTLRVSSYDDTEFIQQQIDLGNHRGIIGGLWDELGSLQVEFLKSQGLLPQHALLDVGAGSFRAGIRLVPYLEPGNYYAIDRQAALLEAGYTREIEPAGLSGRFPRRNFAATAAFDLSGFRRMFDIGIAQSVFTHMPIARLEGCLAAITPHFQPGGRFFVTVFLAPPEVADKACKQIPGGIATWPDRDPFHTTLLALEDVAARTTSWDMSVIGNWDHPRNQQMLCFIRRR